ncbi:sodium:solute symporter [Chloroflexota bacterium]
MPELLIVGFYFAIMLIVGIYVYRRGRVSKSDGFYVADRKGSSLLITGSLLASIIGASSTLGLAGWGFTRGLTGMWWLLVGSVGLIVLSFTWIKTIRRFGLYTLPELVERQYGKEAGFVASILIVISWVAIIAAQIIAAGKVLGILVDGSDTLLMVIPALVFIAYTVLGAQYSIIRTDFIQSILLIGGIIVALFLVLSKVGWVDGLMNSDILTSEYFSFPIRDTFGWIDLVTLLILTGGTYVVGPDIYSRIFCAKNEEVAKSSTLYVGLAIIPISFCIVIIGMGAKVLYSAEISSEQAFPYVIGNLLPVGLSGLVTAALLAAIMSSADTCLLTTSTIFTEDIYKRIFPNTGEQQRLLISRLGILIIGIIALLIALQLGGIISSLLYAYTIFTSGIVIPVLIGFHRDKFKVNSAGALAAIIGGGVTALVVKLMEADDFQLLGVGVCILLLFGVSWITGRRRIT